MAEILWYETIDSTNSEALRRLHELDNLSVIAAFGQTGGRGQGDHLWHSRDGENLTFTLVLRGALYGIPAPEQRCVSCWAALAVRNYLLSKGVEARIKWPNDIWVKDRKICGLLIRHTVTDGLIGDSIIGIGLNLNETRWPEDLPNPVSLKELTGKDYRIEDELTALYDEIRRLEPLLRSADGRSHLQEEFGKYLFRLPEEPGLQPPDQEP